MKYSLLLCVITMSFCFASPAKSNDKKQIRLAVFNVSMEASNYVERRQEPQGNELSKHLQSGQHSQIKNIAEIIQRIRPDIILLNEFDYSANAPQDIAWFIENYLNQAHVGLDSIDYPYAYSAPVNTGVDSGLDLDRDGVASGVRQDAFGFGLYPGHYGMAILSKYPIKTQDVRTFQYFLWKNMPDNLLNDVINEDGSHYYSEEARDILRLSSKSHWDVPIQIGNKTIHLLASHPTPPSFDGFEDRNGKRNHDEIRFWVDYITGSTKASYITDDQGKPGGFAGEHFIVAGDLNSSPKEGSSIKRGIIDLLNHPLVNDSKAPTSEGGKQHSPDNPYSASHTAAWRSRVDYVLPSTGLNVYDSGVFWPKREEPLFRLVEDRKSSSDHRLVWIDLMLD